MNRLQGTMSGILAAGFIGFLTFGNTAFAGQVSRQQILEALTAQPKVTEPRRQAAAHPFADLRQSRLRRWRARSRCRRSISKSTSTSTPRRSRAQAEPQLDELGDALTDPKLKGATISINGHTDGVGGDAFNKKLSERRATMIKEYLVDNFQLSAANLRTIGYGKSRPKNKIGPERFREPARRSRQPRAPGTSAGITLRRSLQHSSLRSRHGRASSRLPWVRTPPEPVPSHDFADRACGRRGCYSAGRCPPGSAWNYTRW